MRAGEVVITIDVGGSGLKLAAYSVAQHRCIDTSVTPWPTASWSAGSADFDVQVWWETTLSALASLIAELDRRPGYTVAGITVGAVRIPFVLLDGDGEILGPCLSNGDRRADDVVRHLRATYGDEAFYRATGHWLTPEFGLPKLLWLRQWQPDLISRTRRVAQLHDWFIYQLCGAWCSEASSSAMSQWLSADGESWSETILDEFELPSQWFPELMPAGTNAGRLRPTVAEFIGLCPGVPVHVGGGDTQLSALGAGALAEAGPQDHVARPVIVAGTTVPVQWAVTRNPNSVTDLFPLLASHQLVPGWWSVEANAGGVGATLDVLRRLDPYLSAAPLMTAMQAASLCSMPNGTDDIELLVTLGNPMFGPKLWADAPVGRIYGLRPEHTAADVYDAALRSSALAVTELLADAPADFAFSATVMVTGGLTANRRWVQLVANFCRRTLQVPDSDTNGIAGASLVAGQSLWTAADTSSCLRYTPAHELSVATFSQAYNELWSQLALDHDSVDGEPLCAR